MKRLIHSITTIFCGIGLIYSKAPLLVYYGPIEAQKNLIRQFKYAILDPDQLFETPIPPKQNWIAYLSLGEIDEHRWYWTQFQDKSWILPSNPNWPRSHRVDPRSPEWQNFILTQLVPQLQKQGWKGLFFDTVDNGPWLESQDSLYRGSRQAMIDLIARIRQIWPQAFLVMNNGYELLPQVGQSVDAVLLEALNSQWDFQLKSYAAIPDSNRRMRLERMKQSLHLFPQLHFWALDYSAKPGDSMEKDAYTRQKALGLKGYVTDISLQNIRERP